MMPLPTSAIYAGGVVHARRRPTWHRLRYRMFSLLLDIDELPALSRRLRLFSAERFNLFSFYAKDHLEGGEEALRAQVERHLARAGITGGGPIHLLCMPRVLGGVFNPLSVFFCSDRQGVLRAVIYEVHNTFGQRHSYLIPVADPAAAIIRQSCPKNFYVSPFMDMVLQYHFRLTVPQERIVVSVEARDEDGSVLSACLAARRVPLTDTALLRGFLRHPAMAAQVLGGIHWEALKLWSKGMRPRPRPLPPEDQMSIVPAGHTI